VPRRYAWLFFVAAVVLLFLAVVQMAWNVSGLPDWLQPAGLCALAVGCTAWTLPGNPNVLQVRNGRSVLSRENLAGRSACGPSSTAR
jgi:hypothetical protein